MFVGATDSLATVKDNRWAHLAMEHDVVFYKEIPFGHLSFLVAKDMSYFTKDVMGVLAKYQPLKTVSEFLN
jgi:hypothetical protein